MAVNRAAMPFPVLPGKTIADVRRIGEMFEADPEAWAESRRRGGVTLERAYFQETPMGNFLVAYLETTKTLAEAFMASAQSDLEIDRSFVDHVREVHGIDIREMPAPQFENVGEWLDPDVRETLRGFAFCAPIIPEMQDKGREWAAKTFSSEGMTTTRRRLGESKELVTLVQTPNGPVTGVYLEGRDPVQANRDFTASSDPFDIEFRAMLKQLYPPFINFDQPVPGITEVFDSQKLPVSV
ncbi:MAG: hypothetical protein JOY80_09595 [Candidatus Dormibacteraeota bacterium]|nr:hypothetical protein [Candidatus Dormibacteraeota bacterium]